MSQNEADCITYWTEAFQTHFKGYMADIFPHVSTFLDGHPALSLSNFCDKIHNMTEFIGLLFYSCFFHVSACLLSIHAFLTLSCYFGALVVRRVRL